MAVSPTGAALARRNAALPLNGRLAALVRLGAWLGAYADVLLIGSLVAAAGLVRWPNLLISPQFPSGGTAIPMALEIADGQAFYLREVSPYIGGPYIWLLALVYKLFGPSVEATMLVTWAIGALTIVPTYLLGREVGGRLVGLLAAALLATSGAHTVVTSHVPISHSVTPLVSTTVLWLLVRAVNRAPSPDGIGQVDASTLAQGGRLLALAGFLSGLALQTHPTVAPLLVGAGAGALLMRRGWLRTRWPAIVLAAAVLGYSTLLVYHVTSGFEIISDIQIKQARYLDAGHDVETGARTAVYPTNLGALLLSSARLMSGTLDEREGPADFLTDPWVLAPAAVALVGLVIGVRRRAWWLVGTMLLAVFLPPAFNGKYRPILDGRFIMPLLPVLFVALGLAISSAVTAISAGLSGGSGASATSRRLAQGVAVTALVIGSSALVLHPLAQLDEFYDVSIEDGFNNTLYLQTLHQLQAARQGDEAVVLDPQLMQVKSLGGGKAWTSLTWLLAVSRLPSESLDDVSAPADLTGRLAILQRDTADRLDETLTLEPLDGRKLSGKERPSYRAYRIAGPAESK